MDNKIVLGIISFTEKKEEKKWNLVWSGYESRSK